MKTDWKNLASVRSYADRLAASTDDPQLKRMLVVKRHGRDNYNIVFACKFHGDGEVLHRTY